MKKISIVVPCYNEEKMIELFYQELMKTISEFENDYNYEIIFVDDGSKDKTLQKLRQIKKQNNKCLFAISLLK